MEKVRLGGAVALLTALGMMILYLVGAFDSVVDAGIVDGRFDNAVVERASTVEVQRKLDKTVVKLSRYDNEWINHAFGIELRQFPGDLTIYDDIIWETRPDIIVESGTLYGGLTLYFSALLSYVNPDAKIITIDIQDDMWNESLAKLDLPEESKKRLLSSIEFIKGDSVAPETLEKIKKLIPEGASVMVLLDSLHTRDHVFKELELYSPLVTVGDYLIVNDTDIDGKVEKEDIESYVGTPNGAMQAVTDWAPTAKNFELAAEKLRFRVTCNSGGIFLRKE